MDNTGRPNRTVSDKDVAGKRPFAVFADARPLVKTAVSLDREIVLAAAAEDPVHRADTLCGEKKPNPKHPSK